MYPEWGTACRHAVRHIVGEVRISDLRWLAEGAPGARPLNGVRAVFEWGPNTPDPARQPQAVMYGDDRSLPPSDVDAIATRAWPT